MLRKTSQEISGNLPSNRQQHSVAYTRANVGSTAENEAKPRCVIEMQRGVHVLFPLLPSLGASGCGIYLLNHRLTGHHAAENWHYRALRPWNWN